MSLLSFEYIIDLILNKIFVALIIVTLLTLLIIGVNQDINYQLI